MIIINSRKPKLKVQNALLHVLWNGHVVAAIYTPEQNLGVAGVRVGKFYADYSPETYMVYINFWQHAKLWFYPTSFSGKLETAAHYIRFGRGIKRLIRIR